MIQTFATSNGKNVIYRVFYTDEATEKVAKDLYFDFIFDGFNCTIINISKELEEYKLHNFGDGINPTDYQHVFVHALKAQEGDETTIKKVIFIDVVKEVIVEKEKEVEKIVEKIVKEQKIVETTKYDKIYVDKYHKETWIDRLYFRYCKYKNRI